MDNSQVEIFKAARLFSPHEICYLRAVANDIDAISDAAVIRDLKNELPRYLTKADGIAPDADPVCW